MNPIIELPVGELKSAIAGLNRIIGKSHTLPVLGCLRIHRELNSGITIEGTNLDDYATYRVDGKSTGESTGESAECLVTLEDISRIAKACTAKDTIKITKTEDKAVTVMYPVGGNNIVQSFEVPPVKDYPPAPKVETPSTKVGQKFQTVLRSALDCAGEDGSRPILHGAFVDVTDPKSHYIVATDGRHLFTANSFSLDLPQSLIVPSRRFMKWSGIIEDGDWLLSGKPPEDDKNTGWIKIQSKHWTFISRQPDGDYPGWRKVVRNHSDAKTFVTLKEESVAMVLDVLPKLPGKENPDQPITLIVADNQLFLQAQNRGSKAMIKMQVPGASAKGESMTITVNRSYVIKAMKMRPTTLEMECELTAIVFKGDGQRMIIMPLRPQGAPEPSAPETNSPASNNPTATTAPPDQPQEPAVVENNNQNSTEERTPMPKTKDETKIENNEPTPATTAEPNTTTPAVEINPNPLGSPTPIKQAMDQVDLIKEIIRGSISGLNDLLKMLGQVQREKRSTEREIETIRDSLRSLQRVKI